VPEGSEPSAKLRAALKGRVSRRSGRFRLTLARECQALSPAAQHSPYLVVSPPGLGRHRAESCDGSGQIALHHLRPTEAKAALARVEPSAYRFGEVASFLGGRAHADRVTRGARAQRLEGEDLAEPPPIV
jgi:hypothetical protein